MKVAGIVSNATLNSSMSLMSVAAVGRPFLSHMVRWKKDNL